MKELVEFRKLRVSDLFKLTKTGQDFRLNNPVLMKTEEHEEANSIYIEGQTGRFAWKIHPTEMVEVYKARLVIEDVK